MGRCIPITDRQTDRQTPVKVLKTASLVIKDLISVSRICMRHGYDTIMLTKISPTLSQLVINYQNSCQLIFIVDNKLIPIQWFPKWGMGPSRKATRQPKQRQENLMRHILPFSFSSTTVGNKERPQCDLCLKILAS